MDEKHMKPKYEAPRIISMEEIRSSIGGGMDPTCTPGNTAYNCNAGDGGVAAQECVAGPSA